MELSHCTKRKAAVKMTMYQNPAVSEALYGTFQNHWLKISILNPENCCIPCRYRLLGEIPKQPLSNSEPPKHKKYKLVAYKKISILSQGTHSIV